MHNEKRKKETINNGKYIKLELTFKKKNFTDLSNNQPQELSNSPNYYYTAIDENICYYAASKKELFSEGKKTLQIYFNFNINKNSTCIPGRNNCNTNELCDYVGSDKSINKFSCSDMDAEKPGNICYNDRQCKYGYYCNNEKRCTTCESIKIIEPLNEIVAKNKCEFCDNHENNLTGCPENEFCSDQKKCTPCNKIVTKGGIYPLTELPEGKTTPGILKCSPINRGF